MKRRQGGLTLIEVMVAILLMAVVSLIAWRGLDSVTRTDSHLRTDAQQSREVLHALLQLERDVALRANVELQEPDLTNSDPEHAAKSKAISVRGTDSNSFRLDLIRRAATSENGLQRVRWWLQGDTLYRASAAARDRFPLPAPTPREGVAVLRGITGLQVRIWAPGEGWRQLSGNRKNGPRGLEIQLSRATPQGEERFRQVLGPLD